MIIDVYDQFMMNMIVEAADSTFDWPLISFLMRMRSTLYLKYRIWDKESKSWVKSGK
jgi:hypothetical protein